MATSPKNSKKDLLGNSDKSKNKKINAALIQKAMKASPMTEKAHKPAAGQKKPQFNFNLGGGPEIAEKGSEDSHSTQLKKDKEEEEDKISFDLDVEEINVE